MAAGCREEPDDHEVEDGTGRTTGSEIVDCHPIEDAEACESTGTCAWNEEHTTCVPDCAAIVDAIDCLTEQLCTWDVDACVLRPI
jgi:hypothetical protein